jgi:hypothetical protein
MIAIEEKHTDVKKEEDKDKPITQLSDADIQKLKTE